MVTLFRFQQKKWRFNSLHSYDNELLKFLNTIFLILIRFAKYLHKTCSFFFLTLAINSDTVEVTVSRKYLANLLLFLKQHTLCQLNFLIDYTVVDHPGKRLRFELVLLALSSTFNYRLKIRLFTNEIFAISTATQFYKIAFWLEREIWDMFGVLFKNHGDLRRLLTDYGFRGHPLRKDFPLTGYHEVFFDDFKKNIILSNVSLAQEYRYYNFLNPWVL